MVEFVFSKTDVDACCEAKSGNVVNHSQSDAKERGEAGCDDLCSPFQPCCPYITFSGHSAVLNIPKPSPLIEKTLSIYRASANSGYSPDFWQPPRTV